VIGLIYGSHGVLGAGVDIRMQGAGHGMVGLPYLAHTLSRAQTQDLISRLYGVPCLPAAHDFSIFTMDHYYIFFLEKLVVVYAYFWREMKNLSLKALESGWAAIGNEPGFGSGLD
jgi:hypothetical protein